MVVKRSAEINVTGMPRTGSTFVWRLVKRIIDDKRSTICFRNNELNRSHSYVEKIRFNEVFLCIRDPRDALISYCAVHEMALPKATSDKDWNKFLNDACRMYALANNGYVVIRYERFHQDNLLELYKLVSDTLGAEIDIEYAEKILDELSINKAKEIADKHVIFRNFDKANMIHGNHITHNGEIGYWKNYTEFDYVFKHFEEQVRALGYE